MPAATTTCSTSNTLFAGVSRSRCTTSATSFIGVNRLAGLTARVFDRSRHPTSSVFSFLSPRRQSVACRRPKPVPRAYEASQVTGGWSRWARVPRRLRIRDASGAGNVGDNRHRRRDVCAAVGSTSGGQLRLAGFRRRVSIGDALHCLGKSLLEL